VSSLIRPSTTKSTAALYAKSVLNALLFFALFMVAAPWLAAWLAPTLVPVPPRAGAWIAAVLFVGGLALWMLCLDAFSRRGRGTPLPLDAPAELVHSGPFAMVRNPIMIGELAVIWAEAILFARLGIFVYAGLATAAASGAVVLVEEPELRRRFGASYDDYCRRVPRWLPLHLRPRGS
jgi:protein-S-isoprenylcysteine O-methyltransferase Ste14